MFAASPQRKLVLFGMIAAVLPAICFAFVITRRRDPGHLIAIEPSVEWQSTPTRDAGAGVHVPARFVLKNTGGKAVAIHEVRSGCGCAKPRLLESVVQPGKQANLLVDPTPIEFGGRTVSIDVETDSPKTPRLTLELQVKGWHKPPYLQNVLGDLTFRDAEPGTAITFETTSFCTRGDDTPLRITNSIPGLAINLKESIRKDSPDGANLMLRIDRYEAKVVAKPSEAAQIGSLTVDDPWNEGHNIALPVRFDVVPAIRIIPSRITLNTGKSGSAPPAQEFRVLGRKDLPASLENAARADASVLEIERQSPAEASGRVAKYRVALTSAVATPRTIELVLRGFGDGLERTVPVHVVHKP